MIEEILVGRHRRQETTGAAAYRVEPAQERSVARIDALLDAAAQVVDEIGFDRLTTAHVAELSRASIGTVYRYFPDRIALLAALQDRAILRYRLAAAEEIERRRPATWQEVVATLADTFAAMFRSEPGFRIMRFDERRRAADGPGTDHVREFAERVADVLVSRYGFVLSDELVFRLDIASQMAQSLIERAYLREPGGDRRLLDEAPVVAVAYLEKYYS